MTDGKAAPTLDEIGGWPATVGLPAAGAALGLSRSHVYELARRGDFPVRVLRVGRKLRVVTADLVRFLGGVPPAAPVALPPPDGEGVDARARAGLVRSLVGRRADRGLSQAEVARLMGTTQSAVSDLERGLTEPQLDTLQRFARAVGCVLEVRVR